MIFTKEEHLEETLLASAKMVVTGGIIRYSNLLNPTGSMDNSSRISEELKYLSTEGLRIIKDSLK